LNLKLSLFEKRALNDEKMASSVASRRRDSMKRRRAHLKNELLIQSDRLEVVDDTDAGVRAAADDAGVEEAAR
jgi:hypothetical protein